MEKAVGSITDEARIVGKDGDVVGTGPYFGVGLDPHAGKLSPFRLKEGRFATGPGQVVIDAGTADREGYSVGDTHRRPGPRARSRRCGSPASARSATSTRSAPRRSRCSTCTPRSSCSTSSGSYTEILVGGPDSVRKQLSASLGDSLQVQTAAANDRFTLDGLKTFVKFLKILLLVFGGIAVFVGAFTIYNTLSITVAQRSRELALLRALGATRRQVLRSVVVEALAIGTVASVIGVAAGLGLAKLLSERVRVGRRRPAVHEHGVRHADDHRVARRGHRRDGAGRASARRCAPRASRRSRRCARARRSRPDASAAARRCSRRSRGVLALAVLGLGLFGPGIDAERPPGAARRPARCCCSSPWR